jgi:hypothetical protein
MDGRMDDGEEENGEELDWARARLKFFSSVARDLAGVV